MDERTKRAKLKTRRKLLFEKFMKTSLEIRLAPEIKLIDDQVAECTDQISRQREKQK
jgi:hypothetical protein